MSTESAIPCISVYGGVSLIELRTFKEFIINRKSIKKKSMEIEFETNGIPLQSVTIQSVTSQTLSPAKVYFYPGMGFQIWNSAGLMQHIGSTNKNAEVLDSDEAARRLTVKDSLGVIHTMYFGSNSRNLQGMRFLERNIAALIIGDKEDVTLPSSEDGRSTASPPRSDSDVDNAMSGDEALGEDPQDALPKGTFVMDDFKRFYSKNDVDKSIPYFWKKFDPDHYSIWFGGYKYNEELTTVLMSCNLITGMYQRLDTMRKNSFASVNLFGEDNNSSISGVWIWRGQDLAFPQSPEWQTDYETYEWKKLDPNDPETKKLVKDYWSWEGTDSKGRKFNQGKVFK